MAIALSVFFINSKNLSADAAPNYEKSYFVVTKSDDRDHLDRVLGDDGRVEHELSGRAKVVRIKDRKNERVKNNPEFLYVSEDLVNIEEVSKYGWDVIEAAEAWNYQLTQINEIPAIEPAPIEDDLLQEPSDGVDSAPLAPGEAYGRGFYDTSEFMLGKVSVAAFLVESNGGSDPSTEDWDSARESQVHGEIQSAMEFWNEVGNPAANLSFKYHFIDGRDDSRARTRYEPITRVSWTTSGGQDLWIEEIMSKMGYGSGDYFDRVRSYLNDLIVQDGSDWAFAVFVVDSENDADGRFADGKFAYAYYGGPFMVATYDNNGYAISNMDAVIAHEMGHTFFALDQYYAANMECTKSVGYLNIENQNSEYNPYGGTCRTDVPSIMRGGVTPFINRQIDAYAKGQVGWWDGDGDGKSDIIDTYPQTNLNNYSGSSKDTTPSFSGEARVSPLINNNPYFSSKRDGPSYNMTINEIVGVQYRVNHGSWKSAKATDGSFNEPVESFKFTTNELPKGVHTIDARAKNSAGNWETSYASQTIAIGNLRILSGAGFSGGPQVRIFDQLGNLTHPGFFAYEEHVRNGVKVAAGDVDGDGVDEIITGTGNGSGPHVRIFESDGRVQSPGFFAYEEHFRGGVNVASGDLDGDGVDEIIAGAGVGGGPHIRVFDKDGNPKLTAGFFAFSPFFRGGVTVAAGDIDNDGVDEIIAGAGTGGGPHIRMFEGDGRLMPNSFFAFHPDSRTGVDVAAGDFDSDGQDEVVASQLANGEAWIKVYQYNDEKTILGEFRAYGEGVETGANITAADVDGDGRAEIITGPGYGGGPQVRIFEVNGAPILNSFFTYADTFRGGTYVAVGNF